VLGTPAIGPIDRLADTEADQAGADGRQDRHSPRRYVGFGRIDQPDRSFCAAFLICEGHTGAHCDDVGRDVGASADGGTVDLFKQQFVEAN